MPEGDTVYLTAQNLNLALAGQVLLGCDIRVPSFATVDFSGEVVHSVVPRGKHLFIRVGAVSIHTHLKMEGSWHLYRPGSRWKRPAAQARIILSTAEWVAVGFQLGLVEVVATGDEASVIGHLGPDPLAADWDAGEAVGRMLREPGRAIGLALLDQRVIAGLGNVYRNEVCFLRGVLPTRRTDEIADLTALVDLAQRLIHANRERTTRTTTGRLRGEAFWVHGREGRPCLRCGTPIRRDTLGEDALQERNTFYCVTCQK